MIKYKKYFLVYNKRDTKNVFFDRIKTYIFVLIAYALIAYRGWLKSIKTLYVRIGSLYFGCFLEYD